MLKLLVIMGALLSFTQQISAESEPLSYICKEGESVGFDRIGGKWSPAIFEAGKLYSVSKIESGGGAYEVYQLGIDQPLFQCPQGITSKTICASSLGQFVMTPESNRFVATWLGEWWEDSAEDNPAMSLGFCKETDLSVKLFKTAQQSSTTPANKIDRGLLG